MFDDLQPIQKEKSEIFLFIWETVKIIVISLAIILPIRYYLVQPFFVKGASMEPNFENGDYLLVDEISYRFKPPERGEVVVFRYPFDTTQFFIKRIIGLPGETIEIRNEKIKIFNSDHTDGIALEEKYLVSFQKTLGDIVVRLKDDEYFVMGDNRLQSSDSRRWGVLNKKFITGRTFIRLWPINTVTTFQKVNYSF